MKAKVIFVIIPIVILISSINAFGYEFYFTPRLTLLQEYNDNIFLTNNDKEDDFITTVSPNLDARFVSPTSEVRFTYLPAYRFYQDNTDENSWRHVLNLSGSNQFTQHTRLDVTNNFSYTRDTFEETRERFRDADNPLAEEDIRDRGNRTTIRNNARARLTHQFGARDSMFAGFRHFLADFDSDSEDRDIYETSAGITYWFTPQNGLITEAVYAHGDFHDGGNDYDDINGRLRYAHNFTRHFDGYLQYQHVYRNFTGVDKEEEDDRDYQVYAPSAGFTYQIEKDAVLELGAGYFYQDIADDDDEDGLFITGTLRKDWIYRRAQFTAVGDTGLRRDDYGADNLGFSRYAAVTGDATYEFTRFITGDAFAGYRWEDFVNDNRVDQFFTVGAGLTARPFRWMDLNLTYSFRTLSSDEDRNYNNNRVILTVSFAPERPFWLSR